MRRIGDSPTTREQRARLLHREQELARALVRVLDDHELELMFTALRAYSAVLEVQPGADWEDIRSLKSTAEFLRETKIARPLIELNEGH